MQNASHSRHKPWDGEAADLNTGAGLRGPSNERITRGGRSKLRPRKYPSILLTGTLLTTAGLAAGALIYPDRAAELVRKQDWMTPSAAWSMVFPERNASLPFVSRADAPATRPAPTQAAAATPALINAAVTYPMSTASVAVNKAAPRDLPWLPESGKPQEQPAVGPTPALLKAVAAPAEVAAPKPAAAPVEAPPAPPKVAVAPAEPVAVPNPAPAPSISALSDAEAADLIKSARGRIEVGDIAGARLLLQRAASGREPKALMALGETYDPAMLARWGARGIKGDPGKAREFYQAAAETGLAEARSRVLAVR
jgi:hypothetical protein